MPEYVIIDQCLFLIISKEPIPAGLYFGSYNDGQELNHSKCKLLSQRGQIVHKDIVNRTILNEQSKLWWMLQW